MCDIRDAVHEIRDHISVVNWKESEDGLPEILEKYALPVQRSAYNCIRHEYGKYCRQSIDPVFKKISEKISKNLVLSLSILL